MLHTLIANNCTNDVLRPTQRLVYLTLFGFLALGCQSATEPETDALPAGNLISSSVGFVDDAACIECHEEIHETFQHVGMGQSFFSPSTDRNIEDFENPHFFHEASNRHYEMLRRDGDLIQRRYQIDADGKPINEIEEKVDWIIGSGNHGRSYVYQNENGEMFELPLHWHSDQSEWGMGPGSDHANHSGFSRRITQDCMFCHNAYPAFSQDSDRLYQSPLFPHDLPQGIGCQRCHGAGEEHIRWANGELDDLSSEADDSRIVNPAKLDQELQNDVCLQCHLQTNSRFNSLIRVAGNGFYAFKPGAKLSDYLVAVDFHPSNHLEQHFQINHHGYRLHQSECFLKSDGALMCTTCHNPHQRVSEAESVSHYRAACLTCHEVEQCGKLDAMDPVSLESADCAGCHMPIRRPNDVLPARMRDHRIVRDIGAVPTEMDPPRQRPQISLYSPQHKMPQATERLHLAMAKTSTQQPEDARALATYLSAFPADTCEPYWFLAGAQIKSKDFNNALDTLGLIETRFPEATNSLVLTGQVLLNLGKFRAAKEKLLKAIESGNDSPECHSTLGQAYAQLGEPQLSKKHLARAIELRPLYFDALNSAGLLSMQQQNLSEAAEYFQRATAVDPRNSESYLNMGLALLYGGKPNEAYRYWNHGAAETGAARLSEAVALAQLQLGQFDAALATAAAVKGVDPAVPLTIEAIGQWHRGDKTAARRTAKAAISAAKSAKKHAESRIRAILLQTVAGFSNG